MAHSDDTAEKHYYIRKKQMSEAVGSSSLGKAVFKRAGVTSSQVITKSSTVLVPDLSKSLSLSQKKVWNPEEVS